MRPLPGFGAALLAAALAALPARAGGAWIEVESPAANALSPLELIEVRGHAGARAPQGHDIVIVVDLSDSVTASCGFDLDGDGLDGRSSRHVLDWIASQPGADPVLVKRLSELDLEDSVLFAELAAADHLIARLERGVRVGMVAFSDRARVVAPLSARPEELRRAVDALRRDFWRDLQGTNFHAAITAALGLLVPPEEEAAPLRSGRGLLRRLGLLREAPPPAPRAAPKPLRERSILLLSDGVPTLPVHDQRARTASIEAARLAAAAGVRVYSFALGPEAEAGLDVYREIAGTTGGRFERIERPGDAIARLRRVDLADLSEVRVENLASGGLGRAVRTFPDGSFDALVLLVPGRNALRITVRSTDGGEASAERVVTFVRDAPELDAEALAEQRRALLTELRRRTREMELWAEVERGRTHQLRQLEIRGEGAGTSGAR